MAVCTGYLGKFPFEIQLMIFENVENLSTLQLLMTAYPSIGNGLSNSQYKNIIHSILSGSLLSIECQGEIYALISARNGISGLSQDLGSFWSLHFGGGIGASPLQVGFQPVVLDYIIGILQAADFFLAFCSSNRLLLPESKGVLQRTLLRFQLFCEVFRQWQESADSLLDFDVQFPRKSYVWFKSGLTDGREMKQIFSTLRQKGALKTIQGKGRRANETHLHVGLPNLRAALENGVDAVVDLNYLSWFTFKVLC